MPKLIYPEQITYVKTVRITTERWERTRRDEQSAWGTAVRKSSSSAYEQGSGTHNDESVVYPTTTRTTKYGSWTVFGNQNQQYQNKTITDTYCMALLRFDESTLKAGKPVLLNLYATDGGETSAAVDVYRITEDWDADTVTWNNKPTMTKLLSSKPLPLKEWTQIDVQSVLGGYGIALRDENYGTGNNRAKTLPKTGEYAPYIGGGNTGCWVQTASGLVEGAVYVQTASGLVEGAVYAQTENGLEEGA